MNISEIYQLYKKTYLVSTDTRKVTQNCLFFALKGDNFNGNKFAIDALEKGASYAIIDEKKYQTNKKLILVDDVLKTLQSLAAYHRKQLSIPIISLTGSNGKTTTKELINAVLSKKYQTTATIGNLNNHIGVPLTLLSMTPKTEIGIVEMGANHLKEIEFLCDIVQPDYGYITNFGKAHLEGFGSLEGVIQGKTELYQYLKKNKKTVFVNANDVNQLDKSEGIKRIIFGDNNVDVHIELVSANPFVRVQYDKSMIESKLIGAYNFNNIASAITIGSYFGVNNTSIKEAIENYLPTNNRSQIINKGPNKIILDAYNANPSSMQVALESFSGLTDTNKIAILGDMFELGTEAKTEHQKIINLLESLKIDKIYLLGNNFYTTKIKSNSIQSFKTFEDFKNFFSNEKLPNSTLLIKGSRGMALERVLDLL